MKNKFTTGMATSIAIMVLTTQAFAAIDFYPNDGTVANNTVIIGAYKFSSTPNKLADYMQASTSIEEGKPPIVYVYNQRAKEWRDNATNQVAEIPISDNIQITHTGEVKDGKMVITETDDTIWGDKVNISYTLYKQGMFNTTTNVLKVGPIKYKLTPGTDDVAISILSSLQPNDVFEVKSGVVTKLAGGGGGVDPSEIAKQKLQSTINVATILYENAGGDDPATDDNTDDAKLSRFADAINAANAVLNASSSDESAYNTANANLSNEIRIFTTPEGNHAILFGEMTNGSITARPTSAPEGVTVTLTVTPDNGYQLKADSLKVNGGAVIVTPKTTNTYTFTMPAENVTVTAEFEKASAEATVTGIKMKTEPTKKTYEVGEEFDPTGMVVEAVYSNNTTKPINTDNLDVAGFNSSTAQFNQEITVTLKGTNHSTTFKVDIVEQGTTLYSISVENSLHGKVEADKDKAATGATVTLTITPDTGYQLKELKINDTVVTVTGNTYTFTMPAEAVTVTAEFEAMSQAAHKLNITQLQNNEVGSITVEPGEGITSTADNYVYNVEDGKVVTIKVTPAPEVDFIGWTGAGTGTDTTTTVTVNADTTVGAKVRVNLDNLKATIAEYEDFLKLVEVGTAQTVPVGHYFVTAEELKEATELLNDLAKKLVENPDDETLTPTLAKVAVDSLNETKALIEKNKGESTALVAPTITTDPTDTSNVANNTTVKVTLATVSEGATVKYAVYRNDVIDGDVKSYTAQFDITTSNKAGEKVRIETYAEKDSAKSTTTTKDIVFAAETVADYTVTLGTFSNGTVTTDKTTAKQGDTVTLTIAPDTGYQLKELKINDKVVTVTGNTYTFTMPAEDVTVTAEFEEMSQATHTLNINKLQNNEVGSITVEPGEGITSTTDNYVYNVENGKVVTIKVTPALGVDFIEWTGAGTGTDTTTTVTVNADTTVGATVRVNLDDLKATIAVYEDFLKLVRVGTAETVPVGYYFVTEKELEEATYLLDGLAKKLVENPDDETLTPAGAKVVVDSLNETRTLIEKNKGESTALVAPTITTNPENTSNVANNATVKVTLTTESKEATVKYAVYRNDVIDGDVKSYTAQFDITTSNKAGEKVRIETYAEKDSAKSTTTTKDIVFAAETVADYTVTVGTFSNGTVTTDKTTAKQGDTVTLTIAPETGYQLKAGSLKVNNGDVSIIPGANNTYTFTMPAEDVTVDALFEAVSEDNYTVEIETTISNGTVATDKTTAKQGDIVTLTITPEAGYQLKADTLKVNNGDVAIIPGANNTYTFTMPAKAVTVTAEFEAIGTEIKLEKGVTKDGNAIIVSNSTKTLTWSSADESIATVKGTTYEGESAAIVTSIKPGSVTIKVTGEDIKDAEIEITVVDVSKETTFTDALADANSTVSGLVYAQSKDEVTADKFWVDPLLYDGFETLIKLAEKLETDKVVTQEQLNQVVSSLTASTTKINDVKEQGTKTEVTTVDITLNVTGDGKVSSVVYGDNINATLKGGVYTIPSASDVTFTVERNNPTDTVTYIVGSETKEVTGNTFTLPSIKANTTVNVDFSAKMIAGTKLIFIGGEIETVSNAVYSTVYSNSSVTGKVYAVADKTTFEVGSDGKTIKFNLVATGNYDLNNVGITNNDHTVTLGNVTGGKREVTVELKDNFDFTTELILFTTYDSDNGIIITINKNESTTSKFTGFSVRKTTTK